MSFFGVFFVILSICGLSWGDNQQVGWSLEVKRKQEIEIWGLNYDPQQICWSPDPEYLRMWQCLEIVPRQMWWCMMRLYWSRTTSSSICCGLTRRGDNRDTDPWRGRAPGGGAEVGVLWPQTRECLRPLEAERDEEGPSARDWRREHSPAAILISDFRPPEPWENKLLLFKPPCLWHFVTRALRH